MHSSTKHRPTLGPIWKENCTMCIHTINFHVARLGVSTPAHMALMSCWCSWLPDHSWCSRPSRQVVRPVMVHPLQHTQRSVAECYSPWSSWWSNVMTLSGYMTLVIYDSGDDDDDTLTATVKEMPIGWLLHSLCIAIIKLLTWPTVANKAVCLMLVQPTSPHQTVINSGHVQEGFQ